MTPTTKCSDGFRFPDHMFQVADGLDVQDCLARVQGAGLPPLTKLLIDISGQVGNTQPCSLL